MRVVEVAHPTDTHFTNGHDTPNSAFDGREYNGDYEEGAGGTIDEEAGDEDEEEYDEDDYDPDAEAEAVARELGNQIWAELGQSLAPVDDTITTSNNVPATVEPDQTEPSETNLNVNSSDSTHVDAPPPTSPPAQQHLYPQTGLFLGPSLSPTPDPMIETIKTMLSLALSDPHVHYALMTTIVPGPVANGANLYTILTRSVMEGRVNPELAQPLSILISALASGSMMMSGEPPHYAPAPHPEQSISPLKRKREPTDEGQVWPAHPVYNPAVHPTHAPQPMKSQPSEELLARLQTAASDILGVLEPLLTNGEPLHESAVKSIQRQLHQVYAFVSTCPQSKPGEAAAANTLQEIGGLIQVVGILSGVPIAQSIDGVAHIDAGPSAESSRNGQSSRTSNSIGTAVYPCSTCSKVFNKLSSLRIHERTHSEGRPYRCEYAGCPASFARNHDLRRHEKSHERQMFRCRGCDKLFSRRDALRRHKANEKAPDDCREAPMDTSTVQHDGEPPRVTRVWQNHHEGDWPRDSDFEDGEIQPEAVKNARYIAETTHAILQRHVTRGLDSGEQGNSSSERPPEDAPQREQPESTALLIPDSSTNFTQNEPMGENGESIVQPEEPSDPKASLTLPGYGLDDEHTDMLERAIAVAAQAAQAQAEAEAAMYEESYDGQDDGEWNEELDDNHCVELDVETNKLVY